MYATAKLILEKIRTHNLLSEKLFEKYPGYSLVLTGHSLGAGVVSVLSVILKAKYPHLKCYAFSPPGCIFRYILPLPPTVHMPSQTHYHSECTV